MESLRYLGLREQYRPSPQTEPIDFLAKHLRELPPHLLAQFSLTTTPKERTVIPTVRNRRLKYVSLNPQRLDSNALRNEWHALRGGGAGYGQEVGEEEREWVRTSFLQGTTTHVGKLGSLLANEEEARAMDRLRSFRRERAVNHRRIEEEESDEDGDDDGGETEGDGTADEINDTEFQRVLKERFIYGLLDGMDYDTVDWDDGLDIDYDREAEDRWFDTGDESP